MEQRRFDTMGVTATLLAPDDGLLDAAAELVREHARRCTRFEPASELMRLDHARDAAVSPLLFGVIEAAVAAQAWSGGRFDPTLGRALVDHGYDRTFEELDVDAPAAPAPGVTSASRAVLLDHDLHRVTLVGHAHLDLGGIAKGIAADRACHLLGADALVDIGGDIACSRREDDAPWLIDAEHLLADGDAIALQLEVDAGGVATSGTTHRRWAAGTRHHVLDPRSGRSAATDWSNVTVVADTCARAEVVATTLLLTPRRGLEEAARRFGVIAIATDHEGGTEAVGAG